MIGFGIFLLILAVRSRTSPCCGVSESLCIVIGLVLFLLGTLGHAIGGRRHYY